MSGAATREGDHFERQRERGGEIQVIPRRCAKRGAASPRGAPHPAWRADSPDSRCAAARASRRRGAAAVPRKGSRAAGRRGCGHRFRPPTAGARGDPVPQTETRSRGTPGPETRGASPKRSRSGRVRSRTPRASRQGAESRRGVAPGPPSPVETPHGMKSAKPMQA